MKDMSDDLLVAAMDDNLGRLMVYLFICAMILMIHKYHVYTYMYDEA